MVLSEREPESTLELAGTEPSCLFFFYFKKNFGHAAQYVGILVLKPGINLCPLYLKLGVLTTGPPEKSHESKSLAILVQRL